MKFLISSLRRHFFGPRRVDSVVATLNRTVIKLQEASDQHYCESVRKRAKAQALLEQATQHSNESAHASRVLLKVSELIS